MHKKQLEELRNFKIKKEMDGEVEKRKKLTLNLVLLHLKVCIVALFSVLETLNIYLERLEWRIILKSSSLQGCFRKQSGLFTLW